MDVNLLWTALAGVGVSSLLIKLACDSFEQASEHLGRRVFRMPRGVRGATVEAIGSSMPELLTTFILLFVYHDRGGFAAGIATCAGSAVFNAVVIPALCVLAVTGQGASPRVRFASLDRATLLRDGAFFLAAELCLISFLGAPALFAWMGAVLMAIYAVYFAVLMGQMSRGRASTPEGGAKAAPDIDGEGEAGDGLLRSLVRLDWNGLLFAGRALTARSAWTVLALSTLTLTGACYLLAEAVMRAAEALAIPPYISAVLLGAAATSVPDTLISMADAKKGDSDDAVSNAMGSNIFDICIALGLPLLLYGLAFGEISLQASTSGTQNLRWALLLVTGVVLGLFLLGRRDGPSMRVGRGKAYALLALYALWTLWIVAQAFV